MPDQNDPVRQGDDDVAIDPVDIQFDQAEYATPAPDGPSCGVCQSPIDGEYYETGGKVFCPSCRQNVEAAFRGGSRIARVLKALIFGSVASAVGAVLYYAILRATGYNIGLVAVVVGVMVGRAVRKGTGGRGGRFYQFLAIFLTYSAIASMYAPLVVQEFLKQAQIQEQTESPIAKTEMAAAKPDAQPKITDAAKDTPSAPKVDAQTNPTGAPKIAAKASPVKRQEKPTAVDGEAETAVKQVPELADPKQMVLSLLVVAVVVIVLSYIVPLQIALAAPISGLIFGFALWEAWKANRGFHLSFNGPFRVSMPGSSGQEPEVERDGG